ncbi:MAG: GDYXXLXY domain-containing protein [Planctomycetes bacterium]|nr:GDYXXLXY domain-containing protein [Planctomycetota bacterium]
MAGVWRHEWLIARGTLVRIECAAPDPYDMLRGRYLAVRPAETSAAAPEGMSWGVVPVWATLATGGDGLARIESLSLEPVVGPTVVRLMAQRIRATDDTAAVQLEWPFDRFYLNERLGPAADTLMAALFRDGTRPVAEVRLLDGHAVLTDLLLDGVPVRESVRKWSR